MFTFLSVQFYADGPSDPVRTGSGSGQPSAMSCCRLWLCSRLIVARALSATGEAITLVGLAEAAGGGEGGEALVEGGGADAAPRAQLGERQRAVDIGECGSDALVDGTGSRRLRGSRFDDLEREGVGALREFECHAGHGRSGAVLDGQGDIAAFAGIAVAAEVEVGIAPTAQASMRPSPNGARAL